MLKSLLPVALFLSLQQLSSRPVPSPEAEFPPQDSQIQWLLQRGLQSKQADRRLGEAPGSPETVRLLAGAERFDDMLRALQLIVETQPRHIAAGFEAVGDALWRFRAGDEITRRRADTLHRIVADARKQLPALPREEAARAARVFVNIDAERTRDRNAWTPLLQKYIEEYRGTEAALLAEVDVINTGRVSQQMLDGLDAFAAAHPGTTAAAKAIYTKGFQWHTINTLGTLEPRGADPTARFMRVLEIVKELESGRYPRCEWVEKAPSLITGFFIPDDAQIAPDNVDRLIDAHREFVRSHFVLDEAHPDKNGIGYLITSKMAALFARKGDRIAGVEQALDDLQRSGKDASAVGYLRALFYLQPPRDKTIAGADMRERARQVLIPLGAAGTGLYHRKALATLASLAFGDADYQTGRDLFRKYASAYPQSSWAWVALLRLGQCEDALGDPKAAAAAYLETARRNPDLPPARVLGEEYAARAYEAAGDFQAALAAHQRALDGWDNVFGFTYSTFVRRSPNPDDPFLPSSDTAEVSKEKLAIRIPQLKRSLSAPGGTRLERGRWLFAKERYEEAVAELTRLSVEHPKSAAASEGLALARLSRFERALRRAAVERPDADEASTLKELESLWREPVDFAATAAGIARASLLWKRGDSPAAEKVMAAALTAWHAKQSPSTPAAGLEADVAGIRRAIFLPHGGGVYATGRWNAFSWPTSPAAFAVVNADVRVKQFGGEVTRISLVQALASESDVVFFDTEQIDTLKRTIVTLGGTRRREPRQIMETPNQPIGDSMQILRLWTKFFAARPGHWGGWEIETYPVVTEVEFTNREHTKAAARVTIGYSGGTVELEKEGDTWVARRMTNQWIT